jgi:hypothetical protein
MAILGIFIQSETGIPVYKKAWDEKIHNLEEGDELLISGFMSAISQFAKSFKQEIGYIRFLPIEFAGDRGVDSILVDLGRFLAIVFVSPFQFHEMVKLKLDWIYSKILKKYDKNLNFGRTIKLEPSEELFIKNILQDTRAKKIIDNNKSQLMEAIDNFMTYNPDIKGISINSFDNTILFNYGIGRKKLERLLYYMGRGISTLSEYEILHKPIVENGESMLICMTNPAISIRMKDILGAISEVDDVPLYYYIITDINCSIGPVIGSLIDTLNPLIY